jgi:hypothetical protein
MSLTLPQGKVDKQKLAAYKRYWSVVATIQGELNSKWIHTNLKDGEVAADAKLAQGTVQRFRQWGRGAGRTSYSYFHGPNITTVIGIADVLDIDIVAQPRKPNGRR